MVERKPDGGFACELVLNGGNGDAVRADAPASLGRKLTEEVAAARVVPVYAAQPAPGRRAGGVVEVATLMVTSVGTLVAVVDTIRGWLAAERGAAEPTGGVHSITVIIGDERVEIIQPSTAAEERLVEAFIQRHTPSS